MSQDPTILELRCPTCGDAFDWTLHQEEDDYEWAMINRPTVIQPRTLYLRCQTGHKWVPKTLTRTEGEPDRLLLDRYLGES